MSAERFLAAVEVSGAAFGMQLHADKFQLLQVGPASPVRNTAGDIIEQKAHMLYLGASITDDGRIQGELSRRIGAANADFRALARVWRQSSLTRCRKLEIFNATICSKLTYGLAAACLNVAERRRLDGFHNRCLRQVWGIKPAYVSRISNKVVLARTEQKPITQNLAKQQLLMYGKVARAPAGGLLRDSAFCPGTLHPVTDKYIRKRGRPCIEWVAEVTKLAVRMVGAYHKIHGTQVGSF